MIDKLKGLKFWLKLLLEYQYGIFQRNDHSTLRIFEKGSQSCIHKLKYSLQPRMFLSKQLEESYFNEILFVTVLAWSHSIFASMRALTLTHWLLRLILVKADLILVVLLFHHAPTAQNQLVGKLVFISCLLLEFILLASQAFILASL
jgi:hypothetical protein